MRRVTGIGGVFFRCRDPKALGAWYREHLGVAIEDAWSGCTFQWKDDDLPGREGQTVLGLFKEESTYFAPGTKDFMVNFRVADLPALLAVLRAEGCQVMESMEESEFGKFGWVVDPEGNKVELWEPPTK